MVQLQASLADLKGAANWVIVSQDPPAKNKAVMAKEKLDFPIYADPSLSLAQKFGIVFKIDDKTKAAFKGYGLDLEALYGRSEALMPTPGVFVLDPKGKIVFSYVNPDYSKRLDPEILRAVLKNGIY